jgi:hypothetical protein
MASELAGGRVLGLNIYNISKPLATEMPVQLGPRNQAK